MGRNRAGVVLATIAVTALWLAGTGCSETDCNGLFAGSVELTFPCDELVAIDSTCASAETLLPHASPVHILVGPGGTCPAVFRFRSGRTLSANISVQENSGCDQFTTSPSTLTEPLDHPCETDSGTTDAAHEADNAKDTGIDVNKTGDARLGHDI
jgi:hypothetical protein